MAGYILLLQIYSLILAVMRDYITVYMDCLVGKSNESFFLNESHLFLIVKNSSGLSLDFHLAISTFSGQFFTAKTFESVKVCLSLKHRA